MTEHKPSSIRVCRSFDEFEELRCYLEQWDSHRNANPDLYRSTCEALPNFRRPHVIVSHRGGQPNAMMVGRLEKRNIDVGVGFLTSRMPSVLTLTFVEGGLIGEISNEEANLFIQSILDSLRAGEANLALIDSTRVEGELYSCIQGLRGILARDHFPKFETRFARCLEGRRFIESLSKKHRYNQRRRARLLFEDFGGDVEIRPFRKADEVDGLMADAESIARTTYQRGLGVGFKHSERMRERLTLEATKGLLHGYILYAGGRPCSFWITSLYNGVLYSDMLAHDPKYNKYYPAIYLVTEVIDQLSVVPDLNRIMIDFGHGQQEYKALLSNYNWKDVSTYIFAPTFVGGLISLVRTPIALLSRTAMRAMRESKVVNTLRRRRGYRLAANTNAH